MTIIFFRTCWESVRVIIMPVNFQQNVDSERRMRSISSGGGTPPTITVVWFACSGQNGSSSMYVAGEKPRRSRKRVYRQRTFSTNRLPPRRTQRIRLPFLPVVCKWRTYYYSFTISCSQLNTFELIRFASSGAIIFCFTCNRLHFVLSHLFARGTCLNTGT